MGTDSPSGGNSIGCNTPRLAQGDGGVAADSKRDKVLRRDLRLLADFINIFCHHKHTNETKSPVDLERYPVSAIAGDALELCSGCKKLLTHALVKRSTCPLDPKPACKHCPEHCYHPKYREQIREVMKFSGRKLVLSGRLDYLFKLLF